MTFKRKADFSKLGPLGPTHGFDINRADFWGWGQFAPIDKRVITNRDIKLVNADAKSAQIEIVNDWTIEGQKYLGERTTVGWRGRPYRQASTSARKRSRSSSTSRSRWRISPSFRARCPQRRRVVVLRPVRKSDAARSALLGAGPELAGRRLMRLLDQTGQRKRDRLRSRQPRVKSAEHLAQSAVRLDGQPDDCRRTGGRGTARTSAHAQIPRRCLRRRAAGRAGPTVEQQLAR